MELRINSFQHLGIPVTDLKKSQAFYESLGFENVMQTSFDMNDEKGQVAMMKRGNMIFEIYQFPEKELAEVRNRKQGHIDHIAFDVDDINLTFKQLKENGYQILEAEPVYLSFWEKGCKYFNITGPDGERLEFNQIL